MALPDVGLVESSGVPSIGVRGLDDYEQFLVRAGLPTITRSVWAHAGKADGEYGWKLHLSATQTTACALLRHVLPILVQRGLAFKIARNAELLGMLNEGAFGPTQVGKFMTIYPSQDPGKINDLAAELIAATREFDGPKVQTDLYLGGVVYTRYGSFNPAMRRDRLGLFTPVDETQKGAYRVPFVPPEGIPNPFEAYLPAATADPRSVRPIGPGYLVLGVMQTHAKGAVFSAVDVRSQESVKRVVLKEGRPYCLSDKHGRDMWFRLRNQARAHGDLVHTGVVPAPGELFEHSGNLYLPIDHVDGRDLGARPSLPYRAHEPDEQRTILIELLETIKAIRLIHDAGYAHRDLSMRNIRVTPSGRVMLLDLEISQAIARSDTPPLSQGTAGFVSPQQLAAEPASLADDLYAFGAVVICLTTGIDPQRVLFARSGDRAAQIEALAGTPPALCELAARCVDDNPRARPCAHACQETIQKIIDAFDPDVETVLSPKPAPLGPLVLDGLEWLLRGAMRDTQCGMWVSPDLDSGEHASLKLVSNYRVYRSTNRGVAGVLYTIARLHRFGFHAEGAKEQADRTVDWLLDHQDTPDDQMPGLHFGEAGVAVTIAETIAAGLIEPGPWLQPYLTEALSGPIDWPDLTHGAAGQGMAAIICSQLLDRPELLPFADPCAAYLLNTQNDDGSWTLPEGVKAMSGAIYTGFAHGVAGMVAFLAAYARLSSSNAVDDVRNAAIRGGQWLLETARTGPLGLSIWWPLTPNGEEAWAWWCHGAPGISLALLALYEMTGEAKYRAAVRACLRGHAEEVRYPNMSQCHGLSGLGEILLEAYRVLREDEWLERAATLGTLLSHLARREGRAASWLVENPYQATPDLMIGTAGIVHFLARLQCVGDMAFCMPLMPGGTPPKAAIETAHGGLHS
jgi:serine/threonine protein kinase